MEITQVTTIKLEDAEKTALQTLKDAYIQCVTNDCFDCDACPLYSDNGCIGMYADELFYRQERGKQ